MLRGRHIGTGNQPRWPSPSPLQKLVDGGLPLVQLQLVADRQPRTLTLFFEAAQLGQPAIKVVEGSADPLFVAAGAGAGQLTQPGLGPAEAISVQLLRLLRHQPILASCELMESLDVDAAAQGSCDFGRREA